MKEGFEMKNFLTKLLLVSLFLLVTPMAVYAQSDAQELSSFDRIVIETRNLYSNGVMVYLTNNSLYTVEYQTHASFGGSINIHQEGTTLYVITDFYTSPRFNEDVPPVTFRVGINNLLVLATDGIVNVQGLASIYSDNLTITSEGISTIHLDTNISDTLTLHIDGISTVELNGYSQNLNMNINGITAIDTSGLITENASISALGMFSVMVHAENSLNVTSRGSGAMGSILYYGNPSNVVRDVPFFVSMITQR